MIVVSDTTSLNYLVLIGQDRVLPALFGNVFAPPAVIDEMKHSRAPSAVQQWANKPPDWLHVQSPTNALSVKHLGAGETEAISLAQELGADLVLIDDREAVVEAERLGLPVIGTLNVLKTASDNGLLILSDAIVALKQTTFRMSPELMDGFLGQDEPRGA